MASLKKQVSFWRGEFKGQVAWMAVWKEGRGWGITPLYPDFTEDTKRFNWEDQDDRDIIRSILKTDPNAVLMNGYYCNLGDVEDDTLDDTVYAVRRQYEKPCYPLANCDVAEWLNTGAEPTNETENQTGNTAETVEEENEKMPDLLNSYTGSIMHLVEIPGDLMHGRPDCATLSLGRRSRPARFHLDLTVTGPMKDYLLHEMYADSAEYDLYKDFYFDEDFNLRFYVIRSEYKDTYNRPVKIVATDRTEEELHIWGPKDYISGEDTAVVLGKSELTDFCEWLADQQDYTVLF